MRALFTGKAITYFDEDELVYWTMGEVIEVTTIINRCKREQTYEHRLRCGTLPEQIKLSPSLSDTNKTAGETRS